MVQNGAKQRPVSSQKEDNVTRLDDVAQGADFVRALRQALIHLYDPSRLRVSPLVGWLGLAQRSDAVPALQQLLTEAMEALKPADATPSDAAAWRIYRVLSQRFNEQLTQREVSVDLGLSIRQLRREETDGLQVLADYLCQHYTLNLGLPIIADQASGAAPTREQELQWLKSSQTSEMADMAELVHAALRTVVPLAETLRVRIDCILPEGLSPLPLQVTTMRQALLSILTAAVRAVPGGQIQLVARDVGTEVHLEISPQKPHAPSATLEAEDLESLRMAEELVRLSGALLQVSVCPGSRKPFNARFILPVAQERTVLVVDDNVDILHLVERYLAGTCYRFMAAADPQQALVLAEEHPPVVILLDVMLPGIDGWELLGRLREHPRLHRTAIVVCTILSQESLALSLGAAAFLRKPVSRQALLDTLDQLVSRSFLESAPTHR